MKEIEKLKREMLRDNEEFGLDGGDQHDGPAEEPPTTPTETGPISEDMDQLDGVPDHVSEAASIPKVTPLKENKVVAMEKPINDLDHDGTHDQPEGTPAKVKMSKRETRRSKEAKKAVQNSPQVGVSMFHVRHSYQSNIRLATYAINLLTVGRSYLRTSERLAMPLQSQQIA